jgi:hypothetical protein
MMSADQPMAKVFFRLERDEDGYPPVDWESLWAVPLGGGKYRLDNVPFYAKGVSFGDTVAAVVKDEQLVVVELVGFGGHSTVRVIVYDEAMTSEIREELRAIGCSTELSHIASFFSVDVPANVDYEAVVSLLQKHSDAGKIDYEESAIGHAASDR